MRTLRLALAGVLVVVACGGGGGGGGGGAPPTAPPPSIVYTADGSSSTATLTLVEGSGSSATALRLDLRAQGAADLYGVAFDLLYPAGLLSYVGVTEGPFLGGSTSLLVDSSAAGRLIVGHSKLGNVGGATGSGTLMTFEFRSAGGGGSGDLVYAFNNAFDSSAKAIAGVTWAAGSVTVTP